MFLGRWPYYGHPDPKDLPSDFGPIPEWFEVVVPLLVLAVLIFVSLNVMVRLVPKRWWLWTATAVWFVAWVGTFGLAAADPGGILEWVFD